MPKTLTVKRIAGRWNARIVFEVPDVMKPSAPVNSGVGLDAGLAHLWSDDQGNHYDNPRWLQANLRRLRRKQRVVSRRKKGSAGRKKAALVVARLHERVANQRLDYYHKLTRIIASTNALVAVEDNLAGLRRSRLARNVHDAAWSTLHRLLEYKLPEHGGRLVKVDPRGTSKTCSGCGGPVVEEPGRQVRCNTTCGQTLDRDTNAARNILARARQAVPPDGREFTPVKTGSPLTVAQAAVDVPVNEAGTVDTGHHTAGSVTL